MHVIWDPPLGASVSPIAGYKLNWGLKYPPSSHGLWSVSANVFVHTIKTNITGVLYIAVWAYTNAADGPAAVTSKSIYIRMSSALLKTSTLLKSMNLEMVNILKIFVP